MFEVQVIYKLGQFALYGRIDVLDHNIIYELKCVKELNDVNYIQLALYAFIYEKLYPINDIINLNKYIYFKVNGLIKFGKIIKMHNDLLNIKCKEDGIIHIIKKANIKYVYYLYNILKDKKVELTFNPNSLNEIFNMIYKIKME